MPDDDTTRAIDRLYDFFDKGIDAVDHVFNRHKHTEEQLQQFKERSKRRAVIDAEAESKPKPTSTHKKSSTAPAPQPTKSLTHAASVAKKTAPQPTKSPTPQPTKSPHFYILESVDPASGTTLFVVTDGGSARAECTTRELAAQILRALEKSSRQSGSGGTP